MQFSDINFKFPPCVIRECSEEMKQDPSSVAFLTPPPSQAINNPFQVTCKWAMKNVTYQKRNSSGEEQVICESMFHPWEDITVDAWVSTSGGA